MAKQNVTPKETEDEVSPLALNEPSHIEEFYEKQWRATGLPQQHKLCKAERALYGADIIWRLLLRDETYRADAEMYPDDVRYAPLDGYTRGGLHEALSLLLKEGHHIVARIREEHSREEEDHG